MYVYICMYMFYELHNDVLSFP
jgi:hypothetical protein